MNERSYINGVSERFANGLSAREKLMVNSGDHKDLCVGLDPTYDQIPDYIKKEKYLNNSPSRHTREFIIKILDEIGGDISAIKPNTAFFESQGAEGISALISILEHARIKFPSVIKLIDAKKGDIENTNKENARYMYDVLGADAITINPYAGGSYKENGANIAEAINPFIQRENKIVFVWCKGSNKSAGQTQELPVDLSQVTREYKRKYGDITPLANIIESNTAMVYQVVAYQAVNFWNEYGNIGLIVPANDPKAVGIVRKIAGDEIPFLLPGVGEQEGNVKESIRNGLNSSGNGVLLSASRSITNVAEKGFDFTSGVRKNVIDINSQINAAKKSAA